MKTTERLDKILAHCGYGTRSEIKKMVKSGQVVVNGQVVRDSGLKINPDQDSIQVGDNTVVYRRFVYIMLNKPAGVISATEDTREKTVLDLLDNSYRHIPLFPVGRLDKDTEGLLLLTNDGPFAHRLLSPKKHVKKTYFAEIEGEVTEQDVLAFSEGVVLDDGYKTLPAKLRIFAAENQKSTVEIIITEGKFHQVKRMFQAVGKKVTYLKRICMGDVTLDESLLPGQYRELKQEELELLYKTEI